MKILVVSDYYPPAYVGGYEVMCKNVVDGLRDRGHDVQVLTARRAPRSSERHVHQVLTACDQFSNPVDQRSLLQRPVIERRDLTLVRSAIARFQPDLCYIWNGKGVLRTVIAAICRSGPTLLHLEDYWVRDYPALKMDRWHGGWAGIAGSPAKEAIGRVARGLRGPASRLWLLDLPMPPLRDAIFVSNWLRSTYERTFPGATSGVVIHNCVPPDIGPPSDPRPSPDGSLQLLFAGRVHPQKGVHTVIEAFARAVAQLPAAMVPSLTVAGPVGDAGYAETLRARAVALGVDERVTFRGPVERSRMRDLYLSHDVLCYPSIWSEPFSVAVVEAMSLGMPVIATPTGGTPEAIEDQVNGLVVRVDDADSLASAIVRLSRDRDLYERLSRAGIDTVTARLTFERMMDAVESHLLAVLEKVSGAGHRSAFVTA